MRPQPGVPPLHPVLTTMTTAISFDSATALGAEIKPKFLLGAALSAAPNKNVVPHALAKRFMSRQLTGQRRSRIDLLTPLGSDRKDLGKCNAIRQAT